MALHLPFIFLIPGLVHILDAASSYPYVAPQLHKHQNNSSNQERPSQLNCKENGQPQPEQQGSFPRRTNENQPPGPNGFLREQPKANNMPLNGGQNYNSNGQRSLNQQNVVQTGFNQKLVQQTDVSQVKNDAQNGNFRQNRGQQRYPAQNGQRMVLLNQNQPQPFNRQQEPNRNVNLQQNGVPAGQPQQVSPCQQRNEQSGSAQGTGSGDGRGNGQSNGGGKGNHNGNSNGNPFGTGQVGLQGSGRPFVNEQPVQQNGQQRSFGPADTQRQNFQGPNRNNQAHQQNGAGSVGQIQSPLPCPG